MITNDFNKGSSYLERIQKEYSQLHYNFLMLSNITRGPRGPWVAHLRKRSKVTVEPIIENPRGII